MKSALAIQCLPLGTLDRETIYRLVDGAIEELKKTGLHLKVGPFESVLEGPIDRLWDAARLAHQAVVSSGGACATYIKVFSSPDLGSSEEKTSRYAP